MESVLESQRDTCSSALELSKVRIGYWKRTGVTTLLKRKSLLYVGGRRNAGDYFGTGAASQRPLRIPLRFESG